MLMNEQVRQGFTEVYNNFWLRYRDHQPHRDSSEWDRIVETAKLLANTYPFLKETIADMVVEFDQRKRYGIKTENRREKRNDKKI